jgi:hypothetical protein
VIADMASCVRFGCELDTGESLPPQTHPVCSIEKDPLLL